MNFPEIGKLRLGGFYVMPLVRDCILYVPVPDDKDKSMDLIEKLEEFSLQQESHITKGDFFIEIDLED